MEVVDLVRFNSQGKIAHIKEFLDSGHIQKHVERHENEQAKKSSKLVSAASSERIEQKSCIGGDPGNPRLLLRMAFARSSYNTACKAQGFPDCGSGGGRVH